MGRLPSVIMALVASAAWIAAVGPGCGTGVDPRPRLPLPDGDVSDTPLGSPSCDRLELVDWDGDGISDEMEGELDSDGDGAVDRLDVDSDDDGRDDGIEAGRDRACDEPPADSDGDGAPDVVDLDSDANGLPDADEDDGDLDADGAPDWADGDDDGDGLADTVELDVRQLDPSDADGDGVPDFHDVDSDNDGILDEVEGSHDLDNDGAGNWRDTDSDNDGLLDATEGTDDCDGDGLADYVDIDSNGDGIPDWEPGTALDGACPPCSPRCETSGEVVPSPADAGSEGLAASPGDRGVVIGAERTDGGFAWIANTDDPWPDGGASESGTVSKVDLETGDEVARYVVGLPGQQNGPAGTAVDDRGDAYVVCQAVAATGLVVKIAVDPAGCVDRNASGAIETSSDEEPLPHGEDECVLWTSEVGGSWGAPRAVVVDLGGPDAENGAPWVGMANQMRLSQLDPDDGAVLDTVTLGVAPYGLAVDSQGSIWVAGAGTWLQRVDPEAHEADATIAADSDCGPASFQAVATDSRDRVWAATATASACRYDPSDGTWLRVDLGAAAMVSYAVAVDASDVVWVAAQGPWASSGPEGWFFGFDADDGEDLRSIPTGGRATVGVSVDARGHVWAVNQGTDDVSRLEPATEQVDRFPLGRHPAASADFIGAQRRHGPTRGEWSTRFEACPDRSGDTGVRWGYLVWDATATGETSIELRARSADTEDGLAAAPTVVLASFPRVSSPVDIGAAFSEAGVPAYWHLEVSAVLSGRGESPVLESVEVAWECLDGED
jgi:sugar lactone lactonase YvrE